MTVARFYYCWNGDIENWCVYDREYTTEQGDPIAIARCPTKTWAVRIRDAMMIWNEVPTHD